MKKELKFSQTTKDIVDFLNQELLISGKLSTNPSLLLFQSYDAYDIINNKTPYDSMCRYTIDGLRHIFPLLKIDLGSNNEIYVEGKLLEGYSAHPENSNKDHIEYIKEIMIDIFLLYQNDKTKIPKNLYSWYFQ